MQFLYATACVRDVCKAKRAMRAHCCARRHCGLHVHSRDCAVRAETCSRAFLSGRSARHSPSTSDPLNFLCFRCSARSSRCGPQRLPCQSVAPARAGNSECVLASGRKPLWQSSSGTRATRSDSFSATSSCSVCAQGSTPPCTAPPLCPQLAASAAGRAVNQRRSAPPLRSVGFRSVAQWRSRPPVGTC